MVAADARGDDVAISFRGRKLHVDGLLARLDGGNQLGQRQVGVGAYHEIHVMVGDEVVLHTLGHAAQDAHNEVRPLLLERMEELQAVQYLLLGVVADGAGVHEHRVGLVQRFSHIVPCHLHHRGNHFTVGHVHLAAVRLDKQFLFAVGSCRFKVCSHLLFHII